MSSCDIKKRPNIGKSGYISLILSYHVLEILEEYEYMIKAQYYYLKLKDYHCFLCLFILNLYV